MRRHNGRVAIVSGAGTGIGRATAQVMIENGVSVVVVGRTRETLEELVDELGADQVAVHVADVTADDAPAASVALALERFGRLDYLVNNAGKGKPFPLHESTDEIFDEYLDVLLRAPFRYCREALKAMKAGSAIVNVSSTYSIVGGLRGGAYSAAKSGLNGLTLHMAAQYGPEGIRSNAVAPGVTETPMTQYNWENEAFKRMNFEMTPMNRTCTAQDVAEAIWFLLSDMGGFINGQILAVDGGWTTTKYLSEEARLAERVK
jgi:meso-butanediol dehydrogenase/(S,S)-butanediol dehydrogenase/diacetyl reductase